MAARVERDLYIPGGRAERTPYLKMPSPLQSPARESNEFMAIANFVEVWLAKEGHSAPVGINYLEKVQRPHLASIYGAMLAGVDYVLMGAGIPMRIPGVLDRYANHEAAEYPCHVAGALEGDDTVMHFDPREFGDYALPPLKRPFFFAIIASNALATTMARKANGRVDGFIIEGPTAGGHNAPPRGKLMLTETGEPVYGERDLVDLPKLVELGLPFYLAGGYATPEGLEAALASGAAGIQVGTAFAYCDESGMRDDLKRDVLGRVIRGEAKIYTDRLASPTGFPFKVVDAEGTVSDDAVYRARPRVCDLGYLREAYRTPEGGIGYRCAAEPETSYISKGGDPAATVGRKCVCNALLATIGLAQVRGSRHTEPGIVTSGDDLVGNMRFLRPGATHYSAADVVEHLLSTVGSIEEQPDTELVAVGV
jgi:nitronate monooxygenase